MKIGDKVEKFIVWASSEALEEESIFDYFDHNVIGGRGCQSERCNHHSHGVLAPMWELTPKKPLVYLGQTTGEPEQGMDFSIVNYYRMGNTFFCLREGFHKHDQMVIVGVGEIPGRLYDDVQDTLPESPRMPRVKRLGQQRGRPEIPDADRRKGTVAAKTRKEIERWVKAKPEGASDFVNRLLEQEYAKEQNK